MKRLLIIVLTFASACAFGQGNTLYSVLRVTPKMGKTSAFESKWKTHHAKYHAKDDGRMVFQILSGDNAGSFLLVHGPTSFANMDKERATDAAHDLDYESTITPSVEKTSGSYTFRWADTLSYNGTVKADKFLTTVYHVKSGRLSDLITEIKRSVKVNSLIKSPSSSNTYIQQWGGSHPEVVIISNLKDGFKQLDNGFSPSMSNAFKDTYIKEYGQSDWDRRMKLLPEITDSYDVYISKLRKDMSTTMK